MNKTNEIKSKTHKMIVIICVYIDDMIIIDNNDKIIKSNKDILNLRFDMKDIGLADVILRIKILRT